ncbi:MAG: metallophosphatase family protein [Armatimonadetes bacterium]|nr:metallophosphatase family protein [Armatimonadota bacterium]
MRYALLSDIHSNIHALEAVLEALTSEHIDVYVCLGDVVGYGAYPNECCQVVASLGGITVRGNHDEAAVYPGREIWFTNAASQCIIWTREQLAAENRDFLASLEPLRIENFSTLCHGSVPDPDFYTTTPREAMLSFRHMTTPIAFFGHTHVASWFEYVPDSKDLPQLFLAGEDSVVQLEEGKTYLINPGAVGQPRDGMSAAAFAIYDTTAGAVSYRRVPYNVSAAQQGIIAAGLPEFLAARLAVGV